MNSHDHSAMCSQSVACAPPLRQPAPPHCTAKFCECEASNAATGPSNYIPKSNEGAHETQAIIYFFFFHSMIYGNICLTVPLCSKYFREEISGNTSIELDRLNCADSAFIVCRTDEELMKNGWRTDGKLMKNWWKTNEEVMRNWWKTDEDEELMTNCESPKGHQKDQIYVYGIFSTTKTIQHYFFFGKQCFFVTP